MPVKRRSTRRKTAKKAEETTPRVEEKTAKANTTASSEERKRSTKQSKKSAGKSQGIRPEIVVAIAVAALALGAGIAYYFASVQGGSTGTSNGEAGFSSVGYVLADPSCSTCMQEFNRVYDILLQRFDLNSVKLKWVSVSSPEGKKIYQVLVDNNIDIVPLIVFEGNIEQTAFYKALDRQLAMYGGAQRLLLKVGDYYVLRPGWPVRRYDPNKPVTKIILAAPDEIASQIEPALYTTVVNAEIVKKAPEANYVLVLTGPKNVVEALARAIPTAKVEGNTLYVPKDKVVTIDLYVMSFCPFGNQAEDVAAKLKKLFGDRIVVKPHFIIYNNNGKFSSLHGSQELHEDIREVCVNNIYGPSTWLNFAVAINNACNAQNADSCWQGVAKEQNLDVNAIEACYNADFNTIAAQEALGAQIKGVTGSPTTFIDGWFRYDIRNPDFTKVLCDFMLNPPKDACGATIETPAAQGNCG